MARGISPAQLDSKLQAKQLGFSSWIEVNLSALEHNLKQVQNHSQSPILPILKGDAYGHGAPVVAAFLQSKGCSLLGVSNLEEALEVLEFVKAPLLLLTPPLEHQLPLVVKHGLIPTITSRDQVPSLAKEAALKSKTITVHIKVDTGFGRLGIVPRDFLDLVFLIKKTPHLHLGGVFTHFSVATTDRKYTLGQLSKILALKEQLKTMNFPTKVSWHVANSAAFLTLPESHLDLVRVGTLLYGQSPLPLPDGWDLAETWQFKSRIIQVHTLPKGHPIGYGRDYYTKKPTRVGVIPVGYGHGLDLEPQSTLWRQLKHGLHRSLQTDQPIRSADGPLPILGRVGMGLSCVDLTKAPNLTRGDEVTVSMRRVTTSGHVPRIYLQDGRVKCIFWNGRALNSNLTRISSKDLF